ncbi:hypothetical protein PISMIDRAFT_675416 [Pisolithus microcarpus 441]|uniref:Uncharacterized protein n=1 Tax=Pisolithus microcarpus 441 TaxID=765257 RepID=A0A0C9ZY14_9AGAM|nr:hypothetical protein PISMIDRAFT_675416 [Pisolithus microcarpus 441]
MSDVNAQFECVWKKNLWYRPLTCRYELAQPLCCRDKRSVHTFVLRNRYGLRWTTITVLIT